MRVRLSYYDDPTPCGTSLGEVEDYAVSIIEDTTAPVPDVTNLPNVVAECEVTSLTAPTATDNVSGTITGTHNATLPITSQGTTTVTWTYEDGNGNTSTQTQDVVIEDTTVPIPDLASLPDINSECEIMDLTAPTATDSCTGSIVGVSNATFPITDSTSIVWSYNDGNGNTGMQTQEVIITPIDNSIIQTDNVLTADATGSYSYQWGDCSGVFTPISGETDQSFTPLENGFYAVEISNGTCSVLSDCIEIVGLSINDSNSDGKIRVYPNPSTGIFTVEVGNLDNYIEMSVYDTSGKLMIRRMGYSKVNPLDISELSSGMYFLKLQQENNSTVVSIIKN
jgi:hypothetical protein